MNIMSSPVSPLSPLSPTIRSRNFVPAKFRNRVPTQLRRSLPLYIAVTLFIVLAFRADVFRISPGSPSAGGMFKRGQKSLNLDDSVISSDAASDMTADGEPASVPGFPKKIWQTWKIDPLNFDIRDHETAKSWTAKNPGFRYEVLTDSNDLAYVEQMFGTGPGGFNRPDIVAMYASINSTIIKADLLRYMVMYAEGGIYADIDVEALKPAGRFVPERYNPADIDLVIGVEIDQPEFASHPILGQKSMSFCQWTFMAKPRLPVMLTLVETIMSWLADIAKEQNVPIPEVALDFDQVIAGTGPSAFTKAVLAQMNADQSAAERARHGPITWDRFHAMDESRVASRVLVLDVEAFAAGQGHSDSGNHDARGALVKHHYHASNWPSRHPRFRHPVYGEVERCNWEPGCVARWDADVAAYEKMTPEEQQARVAQAEADRKRLLEEARVAQEQAVKLEKWAAAVQKAEEEAKQAVRGGGAFLPGVDPNAAPVGGAGLTPDPNAAPGAAFAQPPAQQFAPGQATDPLAPGQDQPQPAWPGQAPGQRQAFPPQQLQAPPVQPQWAAPAPDPLPNQQWQQQQPPLQQALPAAPVQQAQQFAPAGHPAAAAAVAPLPPLDAVPPAAPAAPVPPLDAAAAPPAVGVSDPNVHPAALEGA